MIINPYPISYLRIVMNNFGSMFDAAINKENISVDDFQKLFLSSSIPFAIEKGNPNILAGKSGSELLSLILDKYITYDPDVSKRSKEYWAGWILAYTQWKIDKSFKEILEKISLKELISMYYPLHEAHEDKTVDLILKRFPSDSSLKRIRKLRKMTQFHLSNKSGVNIRSIRAYEQNKKAILKAQGDTLYRLARALDCTIEELLK